MDCRNTFRLLSAVATVVCAMAGTSRAQSPEPEIAAPRISWTLSGDLGAVGEIYRIDGRANRRPNEMGRMFLRPTLSLADRYTIRSEFLLSTEGNSTLTRQSLNQYMVNPSWKWGNTAFSARIGDFSDAYTPVTFNGVQVRGGELAARRNQFQLTVLGGRTTPATEGGADGGGYRQSLVAGKVGYDDESNAATVFFMYAADDEGSLSALPDTANAIDSTEVGTAINPYTVTPQENFVVATWGRLGLLDDQLSLSAELSRSDYTRDRRAAEGGSGRVDYAFNTGVRWARGKYDLHGGYKRIAPGFVSLGVASMHSDQQEISGGGIYRLGSLGVARLDISRQNDNLIDQKEATTVRYRYVSALSLRPTKMWTTSLTANYVTMANDLSEDSTRVDFKAWILGTNQMITFGQRRRVQSVALGYTLQRSGDENPLRANSDAESHATTFRATIRLTENLSASPMTGFTSTRIADQGWRRTDSYALALRHRTLGNKLTNTLSTTIAVADGDESFRNMLGSRYAVTTTDSIQLQISSNSFRGADSAETSGGTYDEYTANLGWSHRF